MKNITDYIASKQKKVKKQRKNNVEIDSQTVMHLFSLSVRDEYGRQGEKNIVPKFYKNGIIFVSIQNSIWAQELWMNRSLFVKNLNEKIGRDVVKNIKIAT
ncbi:MAG: DciA family protein [Candidatus Moraniibacteriota bacterium]|jgi:predicted nucleic acid-binding Zn ribbon protein